MAKKEISCYSNNFLIKHARENGVPDTAIFKDIELSKHVLLNPLEWVNAEIWVRFAKNIDDALGNIPNAFFELAQKITYEQTSYFQLLFFKIAPLPIILSAVGKHIQENINTTYSIKTNFIKRNVVLIQFCPIAKSKYSTQICDFNRGTTFVTTKLKGLKNVQIIETQCAARSASDSCVYKVSWDAEPNIIEKIRNFFFFRFRDQKSIIAHIEESHAKLQSQYKEILAIRDFYSHIMENMGESVLWLTRDGVIDFANKGFSLLVNAPETAIKGRRLTDYFVQDESIQSFGDLCAQCLAAPNVPVIAEFNFKTLTAAPRIGQTSIVWVQSEHRAPGFLITIRDVTNSKKIEQQLFMAEDRYRTLYENSPALIIGLDLGGRIIYANPAMAEQSGYSQEELLTMHFGQLVAPNADFDTNRLLSNLITGKTRLQEVHFKTKSGEWKCITLNSYPLYDSNHILAGCGGIGVDITETKRLNEQLIKAQRMELLGELAGGMAHDFNNLLSGISGYTSFIIRQSSQEKIKGYAQVINHAGIRASDLIKNLLAFSRGDVGTVQKFDANDIVKEVGLILAGVVPQHIAIKTKLLDNVPLVMGNPGKIHQCILNLCMNAKDAIGDKSGTITIGVKTAESPEQNVWIQVEDTGSGIPPDILEKIFDPFFSTKQKKEGTGLGLSVVYGIVKAHHGEIMVDSRPGEGTTMSLILPVVRSVHLPDTKNVLVVDNDAVMRKYCVDILKNSGYEAVAFDTAQETTEWCRTNSADIALVLSDLIVPHMDVRDFVSTISANKQSFKCIWMSSNPASADHEFIKNQPFLQKPFSPTALIETIRLMAK